MQRFQDITVVFRVSAHGCLNITCDFGPHGCLPGIKIQCLIRSYYSGPLKHSTRVLTREWTLARDTKVIVKE